MNDDSTQPGDRDQRRDADPTESYRFDPMTGRPINRGPEGEQFAFDPMTGEPLHASVGGRADDGTADSSASQLPRRSNRRVIVASALVLGLVCAGVVAALVLRGPSELERQQDACRATVGDYLEALDTVDSRLNVGLNIRDYTEVVGQAAVEKDNVDEDAEVLRDVEFCQSAYDGANVAMLSYGLTASTWNDCIFDDTDCDPDKDLDLSQGWADNSEMLEAVNRAIDEGEPIDPDSDVGERIALMKELGDILEGA